MPLSRLLLSLASLVLVASLTPRVQAAVYQQSFSSPTNSLPNGWNVAGYFDPSLGVAQIRTTANFTALMQERTVNSSGGNGNSFIYYTGNVADEVENGVFSDFTASVIINTSVANTSSGVHHGMMVRTAAPSGNATQLHGYYVTLGNSGGNTVLSIYKDPGTGGAGVVGTLLASSSQESPFSLVKNTDYLFTISAIQDTITGSLYGWDPVEQEFSNLLGTVTTTDTTYTSGLFGFRINHSAGPRTTYWRDLSVTTIPEPGTAALLIPFGLAAWIGLRKKKVAA